MFSESFKIVYFAGVLASCLGSIAAYCLRNDLECNEKVNEGYLIQQPNYKIKEIPYTHTECGKSPYWDHENQNLYYVDSTTGQILRYNYWEKKVYKANVKGEQDAVFIIPVEGKSKLFVVGCGLAVLIVKWDGYSNIATPIGVLYEKGYKKHTNIWSFYYGKCDNRGRLFAGTGRRDYRFDGKKSNHPMKYYRTTLNVLWDDKRQKIYFIDLGYSNVKEYPYDLETGTTDFTNEKVVMNLYYTNSSIHINAHDMTIDREGNIYVATVNDDRIYVINPEMGNNKVLYTIKMPCGDVTSLVFGGPNLDILYATTATNSGYCGSVFEITGLGSQGPIASKAVYKTKANSSHHNKQGVLPTDDGRMNQKNVQPNYKINKIPNSSTTFGRSLFYDRVEHNLYYVGGKTAEILRYDYLEKKVYKAKVKGERFTSFIIPVESTANQFVVGCGLRVLLVEWDGYSNIATPISTLFKKGKKKHTRNYSFYYGKCDNRGRLFAGTTRNYLRFGINKTKYPMNYNRTTLNVLWDDKRQKIYFIDSQDSNVKEYPYDLETGTTDFTNEKVVMNLYKTNSSKHINAHDMTIDREGNIYVAPVNDGQIYVINPEMDKVLYKIKMPCERLGSVVFGGPNLDILYVTTAKSSGYSPSCGSVFEITGLGSHGTTLKKAVIKTEASSSQSNKQDVLPTDDGRNNQKNVQPNYKINKIRNSSDTFGRSLFYDHVEHNLYYVGGSSAEILRYDYLEKKVYKAKVIEERFTSFIIPVESTTNQFFVGCGLRVLLVEWDGYSNIAIPVDTLLSAEPNDSIIGDRFIYGKCDARGRLFAGTITYNFVRDTEQSFHKRNTGLSKGLVWNDKRKKIYFTDALDFQIKEYPYDLEAGRMDSRHEKVVMDFRRTNSSDHINLDDMTIDREGNIYVAASNDGQIYVINPEMDKVLYKIKMPCEHLGSVVFGGPNLDILYVTTYNFGGSSSSCGSVYKITGLGSYGTTMNKAVIKTKATSSQSNKQEVLPTDDGRKSQKNVHPNYKINKIRNSSDTFGRSLFYDHVQHNLYYVGGSSAEILRYDYLEKKVYKAKVKEERFTSFIIPVESTTNQFFVGCGLRVLLVKWDGYSNIAIPIDTLLSAEPNDSIIGDRFIYGKCDARGRLFAGTITYNFVRDTEQSFHKRNTGLSKGLVWNDKRKKIYFTDALDFQIKEYPYDLEAGRMDSRHEKVVMDFRRTNSSDHINLDDMTIDREGNIYVAPVNDGQIYVINPEMDKVLYKIKMPCEHLGSVVFGGPNLDILYVTTYNFGGSSSSCGSVYKITGLGSYGTTMNKAVIKTKATSSQSNKQEVLPTDDGRKSQKNVHPNYKINKIRNSSDTFGRSLFYDHVQHNLYYVGGSSAEILRYDYLEKKVYKAKVKEERFTSFIIPVESTTNQFFVGCGLRVLLVKWDGYSNIAIPIDTLLSAEPNDSIIGDRFIYGKCDARGRLFAGTITYNFVRDTEQSFHKRNTGLSKGLVWNDKRKKIYFTDALDFQIKEYPYDLEAGRMDSRHEKVVMDFRRTNSSDQINLDDMTIDREGNIYVAASNDGQIYVINPEMDKVLYKIKMPCEHLGSVVFGGPNLDILYVTTYNFGGSSSSCGSVYKITGLGSYGTTMNKAVIKTVVINKVKTIK